MHDLVIYLPDQVAAKYNFIFNIIHTYCHCYIWWRECFRKKHERDTPHGSCWSFGCAFQEVRKVVIIKNKNKNKNKKKTCKLIITTIVPYNKKIPTIIKTEPPRGTLFF